ncbi:UbiX family flavin prenyltransferase [Streptomyces sp. NPDC005474]|uniref:UbiX family flavin prenyltransferase n=1 Tax=Streptomyces sp. NPDC005474 TaxID=3154878 RepID=UPI0034545AED
MPQKTPDVRRTACTEPTRPRRLVIGITGATGAVIGVRALEVLADLPVETHLVISRWGRATIATETGRSVRDVQALADVTYDDTDQFAAIASGSYPMDGMLVAPCSMRTLAALRAGLGDTLLTRAADVTLKERRRLVVVAREAPLSRIHLENMLALTDAGAVVLPPVLAFYGQPSSIDALIDHVVHRALDQFGIAVEGAERWTGLAGQRKGTHDHALR